MRKPKRGTRHASPATLPDVPAHASLRLTGSAATGTFPPGQAGSRTLVLMVEGRMLGSAVADDAGGFSLALPPHITTGQLDVLDAGTARSVLAAPLDLADWRGVRWAGWTMSDGLIHGTFALAGPAPDAEAMLPVDLLGDDRVYARAFATVDPVDAKAFRFTAAMSALPHAHGATVVRPVIGGTAVDAPLEITPEACGLAGYADPTDARKAHGWAANLANPKQRVQVELRIDGRTVGTAVADRLREDVKALGYGDGKCGFTIPFPDDTPRSKDLTVELVLAGTDTQLCNSPYVVAAPPPYVGYFDAVEGPFAGGWLVNMHDPDTPLEVEALCDGEVIGSGLADLFRGDVEKAGLPTARCGFRFLLERPLVSLFDRDIVMRVKGTEEYLNGSPRQINQNGNITRLLTRGDTIKRPVLHRLARRLTHRTASTTISIIMPVYNTPAEWLAEALNSVLSQWSANWELICVDDGSTEPHVRELLGIAARRDPRVRPLHSPRNMGIARATNFGLRAARGHFVAFMDHDDVLEPDAIYKLAKAAIDTDADLIYSDEALTTSDINSIIEVRARPAFSHDYYLSHPYFVHMVCVRTDLARRLSGWDETLPISADVDFVLRAIEGARMIAHVPSVLYRWRTHESSTGHAKAADVAGATKDALARHLKRLGRTAEVKDGFRYNEYRIEWPDDGGEVLIVIPTKNRVDLLKTCIDSIEKTSPGENYRIVVIDHQSDDRKTQRYLQEISARHAVMPYEGPFNYARMNNLAVTAHGGRSSYLLFLNNDVEAREDGWIARLRSLAARPEVGAVGPLLLYGDQRVQHAGVLVGFSGAADHAMKFANAYLAKDKRHPGYNCNLTTVRDYSAVTAACMMVRRDAFTAVGGFDEKFAVGFNDTDLCLRIGAAGFKVLYDGFTVLYHHESATRTQSNEVDHPEDDARLRVRWKRFFTVGDPFYSPLLAPRGTDHTLRADPGCKGRMGVRVMPAASPAPVLAPVLAPVAERPRARRRLAKTMA